MSLSKKPTDDKKPISSSKLVGLLTPGKKPSIEAKTPTLQNISVTGKRVEAPKDIPIARKSSTQVIKSVKPAEYEQVDRTRSLAMDNTVKAMAEVDGYAPPQKGTSLYNNYKQQIDFVNSTGEKLSIQKDEEGNPMYGRQKDFWESASTAISAFRESVASGKTYKDSDDETNRRYLENKRYATTRRPGIPQFENVAGATAGGLFDPIVESVVIGLPTAAATIFGVPGAAQAGAALTAGTVGFDMAMSKYGSSLEENYFLAREQGIGKEEAYEKAKTVAAKAAGVEGLVQVAFAGMGGLGQASKGLMGGVVAPAVKGTMKEPSKEALKTFARGFGENMRHALGIGAIVGFGQAVVDNASEQEGIHIEGKEERAIEGGGHMVAMDLAIKMITRAPGTISKSAKSFAKGLLASDEKMTADFISQMEAIGQYEQGTKKEVMKEVKSFSQASKKTPDFMGDGVKKGIAAGLIEKRTKLEAELNKLDPVFRDEKQLEIDDINSRLKQLSSTNKPFSVEIELETKPQENATTESTGKVQEVTTEGGVGQYQRTNQGKQGETTGETTTAKTDTGDSTLPVSKEVKKVDVDFSVNEETGNPSKGLQAINIDGKPMGDYQLLSKNGKTFLNQVIIYNENLRNKGYGLDSYKAIIDKLNGLNKKLFSTNYSETGTSISPEALSVWSRLERDGYAKKIGEIEGSVKDRKTGVDEVRKIPIYESVNPSETSVETQQVKLSDKIRKFKVDQSVLTGGDKGAMQSNIAGLPIGIYNASVEAIALTVEAGETIAAAIEKQIESLKKGGRAFDEDKFRKSIMLIDKANSNKGRMAAEAEMQGIKSADYTELQRFALEKYNESEVFRDPAELGKRLRTELDKKMDTSKISDDVFEMIGYDAIVNEKESPFMPSGQKRAAVPMSEFRAEQILTNPKEVFKAIYTAATTQAKATEERLKIASESISDAIFNEKGERVNPTVIAKAIKMFVTSKMDTETAAIELAANIKEIKRLSVNNRKFGEVRAKIRDIKSASKNKGFSTIATRQTTADVDFMAPSKVKDYDVDADGKMIELDTDSRFNEYIELLEDYRKSISGEIPNADKARLKLIDFVNDQRDKYDAMQVRKRELKRAQYEANYDKKLSKGEIGLDENGNPVVSKSEYVDALIDPKKEVSDEVNDLVLSDDTDIEVMREMTDVRQKMLKEAIDNNEIDADIVDDAKLIIGIDPKKISNKNIQLFNNIIEDIVNGEAPSRMGEIVSDIAAFNNKFELIEGETNIRDMAKYQKAGVFTNLGRLFGAKPGVGAYADLGLSNLFRLVTSNKNGAAAIRKVIWAPFDKQNLMVNNMSKEFAQNLSDVFTKKSIETVVNGVKKKISFLSNPLTSVNSYRIGIASTLTQFEDLGRQIQTIADATKALSEKSYQNGKRVKDYLDNTIIAMQELGIIKGFTADENGVITDIDVNDAITINQINSRLNDRETYAISMMKSKFKDIAPDLDNTMRQYYGTALDMSNENYIPLSPRLFGEAKEELVVGVINNKIPSHLSVMRSNTTKARQNNLTNVVKKNGMDALLYYDFDIFSNVPKRYHESANTAYTTAPVAALRKTINSKEFIEFISGKYNQKETEYIDNKRYFRSQISDIINMEREPFVLTKEMESQRNRVSRFFMGRMLNSVDAAVKQYAPSIPLMLMHGGIEPLSISYNILAGKRLTNPKMAGMLKEFYKQTSKSNRATASIEAFQQKVKSIDNNVLVRKGLNAYDWLEGVSALSLSLGDDATTMQSLLVGYIKGLKVTGKIKNYSEFNLETELRNGLDPTALSHAEQFLSFINNESTSAKKGKVFRESNALYMRMLQSFSHNQNVNALIDLGILQDSFSGKTSSDDAKEAALGLGMYLTNIAAYGTVLYGLGYTNYKISKKALEYSGVKLHKNEEEQKKNFKRDATRITIGNSVDAIAGRTPLPVATMFKFAIGAGYDAYKNSVAEQEKVMGKDLTGTIYDDNFEPVLMNQYGGMTGSFMRDLETIYGIGKELKTGEDTKERYGDLIPDQKNAMYNAEMMKRMSLILPFKSFSKAANSTQKVIKDHQIKQIDVDADMYIMSSLASVDMNLALSKYGKEQIDEALAYVDYKKKTDKDFINYFTKRVADHAYNVVRQDRIGKSSSKTFGEETSKILKNISTKNGNEIIRIMNNRYAGKDARNNDEVKFMLMNGVITPTEYAVSIAYDAKGELRADVSDEKITAEVMKRHIDGMYLSNAADVPKNGNYPKIDGNNIFQIYQEFSSKRYQERERKK